MTNDNPVAKHKSQTAAGGNVAGSSCVSKRQDGKREGRQKDSGKFRASRRAPCPNVHVTEGEG